jgi:N-acetylglucosaminyldiphosphoundecaprenol N-acetyl-beta-D-mannosaminyltransferase
MLGYNNLVISLNQIDFKQKLIVNTINPHSYLIAEKDELFKEALEKADVLLPDGVGIVWAIKYLYKKRIRRIAGNDFFNYFIDTYQSQPKKLFFLGSTTETLIKIKNRINTEYPNYIIDYYSPPFKEQLEVTDNKIIIESINNFNPDIIFVGMTAPKQEKWVLQNHQFLSFKIIASIGAVFDFYAGTVKRAPRWVQNIGLEWLPRFLQNPKKLWKRVLIAIPRFVFTVVYYRKELKKC